MRLPKHSDDADNDDDDDEVSQSQDVKQTQLTCKSLSLIRR